MHDNKKQSQLSRQELYELVWNKPITKLAKEFGISDVGLAKTCRRHNIPLPQRGYWSKLQNQRPVPDTPSLPASRPFDEIISIMGAKSVESDIEYHQSRLVDDLGNLPDLKVPENLIDPHPFIEKTAKILRGARKSQALITPRRNSRILDISVSHQTLERALRIMEVLVKGGYTYITAE